MKKNPKEFHPSKMKPFAQIIARIVKDDPRIADEPDRLWATLVINIPKLGDKTHCVNCTASMAMYRRKVDYFIVLLLVSMGRIVKKRMKEGMPFTEANSIHVNAAEGIPHNARNMTGIASALGLIAPLVAGKKTAHWVITKRGWDGLRGEPVQASVTTFRDRIIERDEGTITFAEASARKKGETNEYSADEWFEIAGYGTGSML